MSRYFKRAALVAAAVIVHLLVCSTGYAETGGPAEVAPVDSMTSSAVSSGDTAWMLTSAALVLFMTAPALALFYGGLVRRKNVLSVMMQCIILMGIVSVLWAFVGYSLAFDTGNPFIGGLRYAGMKDREPNLSAFDAETTTQLEAAKDAAEKAKITEERTKARETELLLQTNLMAPCEYAPTIPHSLWLVFQLMFAIITPALICGAYAERMKFSSMIAFSVAWLFIVYVPLAHMVWGKGGFLNAFLPPASGGFKALDFAGGTVVHISSGVSALVCAIVLGKRMGYGKVAMPPHSLVLSFIGAGMLWVGWFGFNGGSALSAGGAAANAFVTTHMAAAGATLGWVLIEWIKTGKPTLLGAISGAVAGLVVITPAAGFTTPMWGILMGFIGGIVCFTSVIVLKNKLGYDDSLDAFGVHGVGGTLGAILTGVFATGINSGKTGLIAGNSRQIVDQLLATLLTWVIAGVASFVILKVINAVMGLRPSREDEAEGLDVTQHGEAGYHTDEMADATLVDDTP